MADDQVDISGMPDPSTIGLTSTAQTGQTDISGMPTPEDLYRKYYFGEPGKTALANVEGKAGPIGPISKDALDQFMANPPHVPTLRETASSLTGLPRAAASYAAAVPAGVASVAGQLTGVGGAIVDPEHAASYLEQGRDRGREWAAKVSNLANYVPATERGAALSNDLTNLPANLIKETVGAGLKDVLPDNAYQTVSDVAQDVGNDLPALGAPAAVRGIAKGASKVASTAKAGLASEAATLTPPEPTAPLTPPVGTPITGDTLRATPNPIPAPDGTLHNEVHPAALPPQEAPATKQPAPVSQPAAAEATTATAEPSTATPSQVPEQEPTAQAQAPEAAGAPSPGDAQRGSVRLFNSPAEEGPKETPQPEQQNERAAHLDAIDQLSGGQLPTRRTSALTGDYNATGDDWQMKEVGNPQMRQQVASENAAMHAATENVHDSVGSEFENSVDSQTLGDRGRVTRGAIQGIEGWFDKATDQTYDAARAANGGRPIASLNRVKAYLADDSNFTNDSEIGLQRAAQQRLQRLWSTGDPDKGTPPGSVNAAERFREFLNEKGKNPQAMGVAKDLKNATDMDVAEHGGPGLFETARAMRRHQYQMLEEPTGIKKLLTPGDSQGINHAIPEHKVMDYIADLQREQHEHVLNVLRAGAHLGGGELAEGSAAALREIQAHTISRMHAAATNADGSWNARKFYNAADRYARNAPDTFKDRPDILNNLKTINDAGNTLHMDKHYPGAAAQAERTGALGHALETGGNIAASFAHEIPMVGRFIGRHIESAAERAAGKVADTARDRAVAQRLVDRNGKQRGSVQVLPDNNEEAPAVRLSGSAKGVSAYSPGGVTSAIRRGDDLHVKASETAPGARGQGEGTARLEQLAQAAHKNGGKLISDNEVSAPEQKTYQRLAANGYDVKTNPHTTDPGTGVKKSASELKGVYEVGPKPATVPSGQRGSVQLFNDNKLNRSADNANDQRRGIGINPRNERNERTANQQMGGRKPLSDEQNDILNRLSGGKQRGSVKILPDADKNESTLPYDKQTATPEFKNWFGKSKVTDPGDNSKPLAVFHGTTHDVSKFSAKGANPESDMGKGFYFSNTPEDVEHNYAGKGPDLTQRIELTAERLESNGMPRSQALARAHAKLMGSHGGATIPAYLRMENPAIIGNGAHGRGTELTHELEYENENDPESDIKGETGTLPKFMDALRSVTKSAEGTGYELRTEKQLEKGLASLHEKSDYSGVSLADAIDHLHDSDALTDITDSKGNSLSNELIRRALQKMGYDGVIDHTVNDKFGREPGVRSGMKGVNPDTVHYIAFKPHQIKSAIGNSGKFSRKNADITAKNETQQSGALA